MYMRRNDRKDQIVLTMLTRLDCADMRHKQSWTVTEIAREIGIARSTKLHQMMDELTQEGSLYRMYEPYKSGGITNYRKVYQINEIAYKQMELGI